MSLPLSKTIKAIYKELVVDKSKDQSFWILLAFTITFVIARAVVHWSPRVFLDVNGTHVHHFTYGIILLAVTGYLAITSPHRSSRWLAVIFGIGLALALDETGMWLHLTNHYYDDTSEDVVVTVGALLVGIVYFREFWLKIFLVFTRRR